MGHFASVFDTDLFSFEEMRLKIQLLVLGIILTPFNNYLLGVKPSLGIWTPEAICFMKKIVQNKMVTVRVLDMLGTRALVELVDKSVTPHVSASKALIDSGFAVEEKEVVADKASSLHTDSGKEATSRQQTGPHGPESAWARTSGQLALQCLFTLTEQSHK